VVFNSLDGLFFFVSIFFRDAFNILDLVILKKYFIKASMRLVLLFSCVLFSFFALDYPLFGYAQPAYYAAASAGLGVGGIGFLASDTTLWKNINNPKELWSLFKARGFKGNWKIALALALLASSAVSGVNAHRMIVSKLQDAQAESVKIKNTQAKLAQANNSEIERLQEMHNMLSAELEDVRAEKSKVQNQHKQMITDEIAAMGEARKKKIKAIECEQKRYDVVVQSKPSLGAGSARGAQEQRVLRLLHADLKEIDDKLTILRGRLTKL